MNPILVTGRTRFLVSPWSDHPLHDEECVLCAGNGHCRKCDPWHGLPPPARRAMRDQPSLATAIADGLRETFHCPLRRAALGAPA